jgi:hypothetical protein
MSAVEFYQTNPTRQEAPTRVTRRRLYVEKSGRMLLPVSNTTAPGQTTPSNGGFGKEVHSPDLGGHPKIVSLLFHTHDRGLAADPAFLTCGEFGRQN